MNDMVHGRKGGNARAKALSPEERRDIAKKAATARWGEKPLRATHKGNFKDDFGIDVECYVLDDDQKTAVITQRGMAPALGLSGGSGGRLGEFVNSGRIAPYVGRELREKLENPLIFQNVGAVANSTAHGYDVTLLIDMCKVIVQAEQDGKLQARHSQVAKQAHVILNASAKAGIKGLVYALSGYDATREEVITAFRLFVREEAREYEKEFPDQLYEEWYRLYQLPKPMRNKPWKFKHLTVDQVYHPLAKSSGKILELTQAQRAQSGDSRHKKLHQFLSEVGVKALRTQLGQLLGIARISKSKEEYEGFCEKLFGEQPDLFK
jgi:hypothetical protein